MTELAYIVVFGLAMCAIALVGGLVLLLSEELTGRIVLPMVALASGTLIGSAFFHLIPESVDRMGNTPAAYIWVATGFLVFLLLEQLLYWHHCHRPAADHRRPMGVLLLAGDAVHNLVGGLAIGAIFLADIRLGVLAWAAAALHELPQEMGDFGVLVHSGWSRTSALAANFASALTFPLGGLVAWSMSPGLQLDFLIAFGAGNFLYIGAVDLIPQFKGDGGGPRPGVTLWWLAGLAIPLLFMVLPSMP